MLTHSQQGEVLPTAQCSYKYFDISFDWKFLTWHLLRQKEEGAGVGQRRFVGPAGGGLTVDPTRSAALGGPRERRFAGPAVGPHGGAHAFWRRGGGHPSAPRGPACGEKHSMSHGEISEVSKNTPILNGLSKRNSLFPAASKHHQGVLRPL
jgi:hypothetical protein